ncbi:diguanylate cyclase [Empedobacter falsenii]|nr:diguanylate cyclase [Empedobacter falsenii]
MDRKIKLILLVFLLILSFSCTEKKSIEKVKSEPEWGVTPKTDTLKFTSGIRAIFQDSKGNYWFGSLQEGVAVYDGKSFSYFTRNDGLSDDQIHSIQEDKKGTIWFETQTGVSSYDGTKVTNRTKTKNENSQNIFSIQSNDDKESKWMKSDTDLWFEAGNNPGVYRYDGQQLHYLAFPPQKNIDPKNNLFAVTDISKGKNNMIWFATYTGVLGYNGSDFTIINNETLGLDRKIEPLHIRSIYEDSKGRLWIGNNGIGVLLKERESIINFSKKHHLIHPNSKRNGEKSPEETLGHVFVIAEDHNGNIWFGDRDAGIWKFDGKQLQIYTQKDGLINDFVLSIYEDYNKELWFGMADGKIYKFDGKSFEKQF